MEPVIKFIHDATCDMRQYEGRPLHTIPYGTYCTCAERVNRIPPKHESGGLENLRRIVQDAVESQHKAPPYPESRAGSTGGAPPQTIDLAAVDALVEEVRKLCSARAKVLGQDTHVVSIYLDGPREWELRLRMGRTLVELSSR